MIQFEEDIKPSNLQEKQNLRQYHKIRARNLHKMLPIPVCTFDDE